MPSPAEREPSAARNVYAFGTTSFLNDTASEMAYWVLPAFLASLGAGPAQLGLIEGVAESVASFAKLFSGYFADHIRRRKPVVVAGYFVANAVKPLLAIVTAWPQILLIRFTDRLAKGVRGAPRDVMVAESVRKSGWIGLWADPVDGFGRSDCRAAGGAGSAGAVWNSQRVLGSCGPGGFVRAGCADGDSRDAAGCARRTAGGGCPHTPAVPEYGLVCGGAGRSARVLLLRSCRCRTFFIREFERHVSGAAGAECWDSGGACSLAGSGFQHYLHSGIVAGGVAQRPRFAADGGVGGVCDFCQWSILFSGARPSVLAISITMAVYGFYYALTQPVLKALVVETVWPAGARARSGHLFLCDQRGYPGGQLDYWRTVEALRGCDSVLFLGGDGDHCGRDFAGGVGRAHSFPQGLKPWSECRP